VDEGQGTVEAVGSVRQPAAVLHDELVGTAAADFPDSLRDLHRRLGISDEWLIVGLDLAGSYRSSWGAALVVRRPSSSGRYVAWDRLVEQHGGQLPVRRFTITSQSLSAEVVPALGIFSELKRWSVRFTIAPLRDVPITVLVDD
jgi:hypothetical protein